MECSKHKDEYQNTCAECLVIIDQEEAEIEDEVIVMRLKSNGIYYQDKDILIH